MDNTGTSVHLYSVLSSRVAKQLDRVFGSLLLSLTAAT